MATPLEFSPSSLALLPNLAFSPPIGIYIALWLDPVGMAEELDIPSVLTAAQAMTPRKYLGYVHVVRDFPLPSRPWHRCHIRFVGEGMPEEQPEKGILSDMCTPIEPTTAHPAGREPLHPSRPFPYPNCYQHHFIDDLVRVPTQIMQYDDCVRLRPREMRRHMNYENGDWVIRRALVKNMEDREIANLNHDAENSGVPPAMEVDGEDHATDSDGHEESDDKQGRSITPVSRSEIGSVSDDMEMSDSDGSSFEVRSRDSLQEDSDDSGDPPDFMQVLALVMTAGDKLDMDIDILPLVRISLDLTEGGKFEDPRGFLEEVATMTQLIQQARTNIIREYKARNPPMATPQMQRGTNLEQCFEDSMETVNVTPPESIHVENPVQAALLTDSSSVVDPAAQDGAPEGLVRGRTAATHAGDIDISQNAAHIATESADHMHEPATAMARGLMSIRRLVQTGRDIVKLPHISAKDLKPVAIVRASRQRCSALVGRIRRVLRLRKGRDVPH
ncbi:predicted protein [Postia placenta Mad-698-R]|nr:predicted protein [Postia placenta Mad-698-R]